MPGYLLIYSEVHINRLLVQLFDDNNKTTCKTLEAFEGVWAWEDLRTK